MRRPKSKSFARTIETQRVKLSRWEPADAVTFRPIAQDPQVMRYVNNGEPWSDAKVREFIARQMRHIAHHGFCFWKIQRKPDGRLIGLCGLQALHLGCRWEVEIGWWLTPRHWGRGLVSETASAVMSAAGNSLRRNRVVAIAVAENYASRRIMQKIGMLYERNVRHREFEVVLYAARLTPSS